MKRNEAPQIRPGTPLPMIVPRRLVGKSSVAAALPLTVDAFIASENQQKPAASHIPGCTKPAGGPQ